MPRKPILQLLIVAALVWLGLRGQSPGPGADAIAAAVPVAAREIAVLYLGARDCPYCRAWEAQQRPAFADSALAQRVHLLESVRASFREPARAADLPAGLVLDTAALPRPTPAFVLLVDGQAVATVIGGNGWSERLLPALERVTGVAGPQ